MVECPCSPWLVVLLWRVLPECCGRCSGFSVDGEAASSGRFGELCGKFGLENRFIQKNAYREDAPVDWDRVDAIRQRYKRESLAWLDEAMKEIDG